MLTEEQFAEQVKRGELHAELSEVVTPLIAKYGVKEVRWMLGVLAEDLETCEETER